MYDRVKKIISRTSVLISCVEAMSKELQEIKECEGRKLTQNEEALSEYAKTMLHNLYKVENYAKTAINKTTKKETMTEEEYYKRSKEIENERTGLLYEQKLLDAQYIKEFAPFKPDTKLKVKRKGRNGSFVCWVKGYQMRYNKLMLLYNKAKLDGGRSMRENMDFMEDLEVEELNEK